MRGGTSTKSRWIATAVLFGALLVPVTSTAPASAAEAVLVGHVRSDGAPLVGYTVTLRVGGGEHSTATTIASATTEADGAFHLAYPAPGNPDAVLYVLAVGPTDVPTESAVTLANVLGPGGPPPTIVVNERTTVASAYAMTQFFDGPSLAGPTPGLPNATRMVPNLVDVETGTVGHVLATSPNGPDTSTLPTFNSLANMVAACVASTASCTQLFSLATPPGGSAPATTLDALVEINRNPSHNATDLFTFAPSTPYIPVRTDAPDAWTIALRFVGDGKSMDGPGNIAVDTDGNIWVTNNYVYSPNVLTPMCGAKNLLEFAPNGEYVAGSPYVGGGLDGAGFGIDIDPYGDIWVGNYGFAAPGCPAAEQPKHNSVSQFRRDGSAVSPASGHTAGAISWPQGTTSDARGNIWIANCETDSVTVYRDGDPTKAQVIQDVGLDKPFDIAHNANGDAFVTGVTSSNVVMLRADGTPALASPITGGGLNRPLGLASDSAGNVWVANSGFADLPCPTMQDIDATGGSVTRITPNGALASDQPTTGGGLSAPWGVAIDGNDHVWVANFAGKRLTEICGIRPETCPQGTATGEAISPETGYGFDGFVRNTGLAIDPSGNVWVVNNWKDAPIQTNPGGYEVVAFVGLAAPVHRAAPIPRPVPTVPPFTG